MRTDSVLLMTSVASAKSGTQWSIESGEHRATVVEVGGVLRRYAVGEREILDGFGADEMSPAPTGEPSSVTAGGR